MLRSSRYSRSGSRDEPLPTIDNLLDLDRKTFDALRKALRHS